MDFVMHLALGGGKAAGTIRQHLSAVRSQHVVLGLPDPTAPMNRLWMAIDGLKKRQGGPKRKKPFTPRMLHWVRDGLDLDSAGDAMIWAAKCTALFLLRVSEYTAPDRVHTHASKGLRGVDVVGKSTGA